MCESFVVCFSLYFFFSRWQKNSEMIAIFMLELGMFMEKLLFKKSSQLSECMD